MAPQKGRFEFKYIEIDTDTLCENEADREISFQVFRYNANGSHKLICQMISSLIDLKISPDLKGKKNETLEIRDFNI